MSELLSLAEAAHLLGVTASRVRQLVVAGQLPGRRMANVWAAPRGAVVARRHSPGASGRPPSPPHAWRELLEHGIDVQRPGGYQRRARVVRCDMSRANSEVLPTLVGALVGGVHAAIKLGEQLSGDDCADLYLSATSFEELGSKIAFVELRRVLLCWRTPILSGARWT